jgi:hypothetical protein
VGIGGALVTVKVATVLVTVPATLVTVTVYFELLLPTTVAGVV